MAALDRGEASSNTRTHQLLRPINSEGTGLRRHAPGVVEPISKGQRGIAPFSAQGRRQAENGCGPERSDFRPESAEPIGPPIPRKFFPRPPERVEDTGIGRAFLTDLAIRILYQGTEMTGSAIAERMGLPFYDVVEPLLARLRHDRDIDVKGQHGIGDAAYLYGITEKGSLHARDSLERLNYTGPCPVPVSQYIESVNAQTVRNVVVTQDNIRQAFADLIIADDILDMIGPAVNSGASIFLFGYPGNGKTAIAERITKLMGDDIFVPYAIDVDGDVVTVFDAINHTRVDEAEMGGGRGKPTWDDRWVKIERPIVMVGGELTMASLDLLYNDVGRYYEAPLQMKANGGMFLIDDFGRQMVRPQDLLNRWIVPLEKHVDFLNLISGKKLAVPFEELIVFSTNLDPAALVDEAFLRRIKFKINIVDPDERQFHEIFELVCAQRGIAFTERAFQYLLKTRYAPPGGHAMRMCHPRDLMDQLIAIAKYRMVPAVMTEQLLDAACNTYFVNVFGDYRSSSPAASRHAWVAKR